MLLAVSALTGIRALGIEERAASARDRDQREVLLFTLAVSIAAGVIFGLVPAFRLTSATRGQRLKDASRGTSESGHSGAEGRTSRACWSIAELALSVMLLVGAGLLIRSFARLQQVSPGFNADRRADARADPDRSALCGDGARARDVSHLWERLTRAARGHGAGGVSMLPLSQMFAWGPITSKGATPPSGESFVNVDQRVVGGHYFEAMQIPLLSGRLFTRTTPGRAARRRHRRRMAQVLWPNEDPIGKRLRAAAWTPRDAPWLTVVGIVGRIKQYALDSATRGSRCTTRTRRCPRAP